MMMPRVDLPTVLTHSSLPMSWPEIKKKKAILIRFISSLSFVPLQSAVWAKLQSSGQLEACKRSLLLSSLLRNTKISTGTLF